MPLPDEAHKEVADFLKATAAAERAAEKARAAKDALSHRLADCLAAAWIDRGELPPQPYAVVTPKGHRAAFVVQDKTASTAWKPEYQAALAAIIGDAAKTHTTKVYSFNTTALKKPELFEKVRQALAVALTPSELRELLTVSEETRLDADVFPGLLQSAGPERLADAFRVLSPAVLHYAKA